MVISRIISKIRNSFEKKKPSDKPFNNNLDKWNIVCVAMDTLEDTQLAIEYYEKNKGSKLDGGKYLRLYGLLQAVYLQQGAIKYLYKELGGNSDKDNFSLTKWNKIRDLRNLTVGHPIDKNNRKRCFISRITINKYDFQYMVWDKIKKKDEFTTVNLRDMLNGYKKEAAVILKRVLKAITAS